MSGAKFRVIRRVRPIERSAKPAGKHDTGDDAPPFGERQRNRVEDD
jgi:hypothetical protein